MSSHSRTFPADLCDQPQPRAPHWPGGLNRVLSLREAADRPRAGAACELQVNPTAFPTGWQAHFASARKAFPLLRGSLLCTHHLMKAAWSTLSLEVLKLAEDKGEVCLPFPRPLLSAFYFLPLSFLVHCSPFTFQNLPFLPTSSWALSQIPGLTLTLLISGFQGSSLGFLASNTTLSARKARPGDLRL